MVYKWWPHERHVEFDDDKISELNLDTKDAGMKIEYRDEAGRPWWKFFDEYEYRYNKYELDRVHWYNIYPTNDKREFRYLVKMDVLLGFFMLVICWVSALDSSNMSQAYVSGMREDLHMKGNDLINTGVVSSVGSIVFQLPFMYIIPRYPAHITLSLSVIFWSVFTIACFKAQTVQQLQVFRFFVGVGEGAIYPQTQILLSNFYTSRELATRAMIFFMGQQLGGLTSGLLQARLYQTFESVNGIAGWRYQFLFDFVISFPIGVAAFWIIPGNSPFKCTSVFLTDEDIIIGRKRLLRTNASVPGMKPLHNFFHWPSWKKVFFTPTFYVLLVFDCVSWNNMTAYSGSFLLWLDSLGTYSVVKVNNYSVFPACFGLIFIFALSVFADQFRCRWGSIVIACCFNIISCSILTAWNVPIAAKWFAFLTTYFSVAASPSLWSFINDCLREDIEVRAIAWLAIYSFSESTNAWIPRIVWQTVDSPEFKKGYISSNVFTIIYLFWVFVVLWWYKKQEKKNALQNGIFLYNSDKGEFPPPEAGSDSTEDSLADVKIQKESIEVEKELK